MPKNILPRSKNGEYVGKQIGNMILTGTQESSRREHLPSSSNNDKKEATTIEVAKGKTVGGSILTGTQGSGGDGSTRVAHQKETKPIEIDGRDSIYAVAFLADGKHVVSGGDEGKMRRWRVGDGRGVGGPVDVESPIVNIAVSQDEKWVVIGAHSGLVTVWNAESHEKVTELKAHNDRVRAVDVSPDVTRIATGSRDKTVCVWSLSSGECLLGPLKYDHWVVAVKFSPDGRLIATATWNRDVQVYDSRNAALVSDFPVQVNSAINQSLAWASDSKRLFALSRDGNINCLDVSTGTTLSKWAIHSSHNPRCIALASNGTFIAASTNSSISFWDAGMREQIGSVIKHSRVIWSMAISANYDLVISGRKTITLLGLCDILPSRYLDNVCGPA